MLPLLPKYILDIASQVLCRIHNAFSHLLQHILPE